MEKEPRISLGKLPEGVSNRLASTYSSVTAGVSGVFEKDRVPERPEVNDLTSEEAFERYKEYSVNTQLRTSEKRMWGSIAERVSGYLLTGVAFALGSTLLASATAAGIPTVLSGVIGIGAMVGVSLAVFHGFQQPATKEQSGNWMDVGDYNIKRSAGIMAQEIKKALQEDVVPVQQAANENRAPTTQLAVNSAELQSTILDASQRETVRV